MTYDIESAFADLDAFYPGSKRKRRPESEKSVVKAVDWDGRPLNKIYNGKPTEFFMNNSLAQALGKSPVTIRLWERKGYIPKAPFRLPGHTKAGKEVPGKRVYTRELIEIAVEEFSARSLLGSARVEWKYHDDLTIALLERWTAILDNAN